MNRLIIAAVVLVGAIYLITSSLFIVHEREQAIVMRFGEITNVYKEPGIHWKLPTSLVDTVQILEDRLLRYNKSDMRLQVSDGKVYVVDAFLTYRITDPVLFRQRSQGDLRIAEQRIDTRLDAALRQVYGLREFNAALSEERQQMMDEARDLIRPDMALLGIEIVDVRILRTDLNEEVSQQTYDRMKAERLAEAALLRARGQEQAQSLRAVADRQAVEIVAAATRDSEILRGEGDALRSSVFAEVYGRDPEFFEFYRSMESYRSALGSAGTTMVLSPESEFFRYFQGDGALTQSQVTPTAIAATTPTTQAPADDAAAAPTPAVTGWLPQGALAG